MSIQEKSERAKDREKIVNLYYEEEKVIAKIRQEEEETLVQHAFTAEEQRIQDIQNQIDAKYSTKMVLTREEELTKLQEEIDMLKEQNKLLEKRKQDARSWLEEEKNAGSIGITAFNSIKTAMEEQRTLAASKSETSVVKLIDEKIKSFEASSTAYRTLDETFIKNYYKGLEDSLTILKDQRNSLQTRLTTLTSSDESKTVRGKEHIRRITEDIEKKNKEIQATETIIEKYNSNTEDAIKRQNDLLENRNKYSREWSQIQDVTSKQATAAYKSIKDTMEMELRSAKGTPEIGRAHV